MRLHTCEHCREKSATALWLWSRCPYCRCVATVDPRSPTIDITRMTAEQCERADRDISGETIE